MGEEPHAPNVEGPSPLAVVARVAAAQCRAALEEGLAMFPGDPYAAECRKLLDSLAARPEPSGARMEPVLGQEPSVRHEASPRQEPPPLTSALYTLTEALLTSPEGRDYLIPGHGPLPVPGPNDPYLWQWFHLALLRLPEEHAAIWRARAADIPEGPDWEPLPERVLPSLDAAEVLVPSRPDLGAGGIRTAPGAPPPPWLPAGDGGPRHRMSVLAAQVVGVGTEDGLLHRCLEHLDRTAMRRMDESDVADRYRADLARRFGLIPPGPLTAATLSALISVDESLCSLLHLPPAAPGSWWGRIAHASRETVLAAARELRDTGEKVEVRVLSGDYPQIRRRTGSTDLPVQVGYRSGQVLACLRLWARVEGRDLPGRVAYAAG